MRGGYSPGVPGRQPSEAAAEAGFFVAGALLQVKSDVSSSLFSSLRRRVLPLAQMAEKIRANTQEIVERSEDIRTTIYRRVGVLLQPAVAEEEAGAPQHHEAGILGAVAL